MKKLVFSSLLVLFVWSGSYAQKLAPYIKVGSKSNSIEEVSTDVQHALESSSFTVLGTYNPSGKENLKVIAFTRDDLKNAVVKVSDRGALAAVFKIGLIQENGSTTISYTNPDYILRAYLRDNYINFKTTFVNFSAELKTALKDLGNEFMPFGGGIEADKLKKYHYKIMMPYFSDPVSLNEYASFEEGLNTIQNNLKAGKGQTVEVYKLVYPNEKVAVFGVGLKSKEDGEAHFLPKIGEAHVAALPYEIILQGTEATMLHGKYRIALHWPDLTMGTFMKIMSTPGDIKDTLEGLCNNSF